MKGGSVVSPEAIAIVLRELQVCNDPSVEKAERWLKDLGEQLELFQAQRSALDEDVEEDAKVPEVIPEDLRHFECLSHLLWWTLSSAVSFFTGEEPQKTAANVFVPGQKNFDDFLCLMPKRCYQDHSRQSDLRRALCSILVAYDSHESIRKASFPEDDALVSMETREKYVELFTDIIERSRMEAVDTETLAGQLELGCNLYASMIATVETSRDELSLQRWRECYLAKCKEVAEWLSIDDLEDEGFKEIWNRANAEPDYALLVPFTKRADLFAGRRLAGEQQLHTQVLVAKKRFDAEQDHSAIESDFECPKCGSFRTRSYHLQMSSAD